MGDKLTFIGYPFIIHGMIADHFSFTIKGIDKVYEAARCICLQKSINKFCTCGSRRIHELQQLILFVNYLRIYYTEFEIYVVY